MDFCCKVKKNLHNSIIFCTFAPGFKSSTMKVIYTFTHLLIFTLLFPATDPHQVELDSLLAVYDSEIDRAPVYLQIRDERIDSLQQVLPVSGDSNRIAETLFLIAEQYAPYKCDSAIDYYDRACRWAASEPYITMCQDGYADCMERSLGRESIYRNDSVLREKDSHGDAIRCYRRYEAAHQRGDSIEALIWLTRSAIADVRAGVTDNASSWMLAQALYANGQIEQAYRFIEYSTRNADIFRARLRYMQTTPVVQMISSGYQRELRTTSQRLTYTVIAIVIILVLLIVVLVNMLWQYRRVHRLNDRLIRTNDELDKANHNLDELNHSLSEMNRIREEYICSYLEEQSAQIRRIHRDSRRAGALDSDEKMKAQLDAFYHSFDTTFLRLYPNFVEDINSMLQYEARLSPPKGELSPELRIFALIRMGITRSTHIAELLCYSNNTIYNYRSRLKNYALCDRDEFESRIQQLG